MDILDVDKNPLRSFFKCQTFSMLIICLTLPTVTVVAVSSNTQRPLLWPLTKAKPQRQKNGWACAWGALLPREWLLRLSCAPLNNNFIAMNGLQILSCSEQAIFGRNQCDLNTRMTGLSAGCGHTMRGLKWKKFSVHAHWERYKSGSQVLV